MDLVAVAEADAQVVVVEEIREMVVDFLEHIILVEAAEAELQTHQVETVAQE
jgi:hypothetical protein